MDKPKFNFLIDALMFLCLMAMAGLGFLMKYVLPPGRDLRAKYGSNPEISWLGWDRHDWGDIHLYLAFALLTLLVLHIILHWQQILGLFQRWVPDPRRRRRIALIFVLLGLLLIYFPFLITPDIKARGRGVGGQRSQAGGADARAGGSYQFKFRPPSVLIQPEARGFLVGKMAKIPPIPPLIKGGAWRNTLKTSPPLLKGDLGGFPACFSVHSKAANG